MSLESLSFQALLPDCRNHVFQYLTLSECLSFGATDKASMSTIVPDLHRRRKQQFLCRHKYQIGSPEVLQVDDTVSDKDKSVLLSAKLNNEHEWHTLPSINERIQSLYRSLPSFHPLDGVIRELVFDLRNQESTSSLVNAANGLEFRSIWAAVKAATKAHELHATVLSRCTIQCHPKPCDPSMYLTTSRDTRDPRSLTVLLEHYVGDVLCAYYLMGHAVAGIVEGGPTHKQWTQVLLREAGSGRDTVNAREWYRLCVYFQVHCCGAFRLLMSSKLS